MFCPTCPLSQNQFFFEGDEGFLSLKHKSIHFHKLLEDDAAVASTFSKSQSLNARSLGRFAQLAL
jgi:hypothetical protein